MKRLMALVSTCPERSYALSGENFAINPLPMAHALLLI